MSSHPTALHQRATALAALTQAVYLVDSIARKGTADAEDCKILLDSLFAEPQADQQPIARIYGGANNLTTGLHICSQLIQANDLPQAKTLLIYSGSLMALERRLTKQADMRQKIADGMHRITNQRQYFGDSMHSNVIAAIANLYGETLSTMKPRIIVRGKSEHLTQTANTERIRALLMAGLRAAHLWHKNGGGHFNLLLRRKALLREIQQLQT